MWFGFAIIVIGIVFLFQNMGLFQDSAWEVIWPTLIIIIGLSIIFNKSEHGRIVINGSKKSQNKKK